MFKVENNVPKFYSEESRDFQLLCRLYDIVLQSVRYSIDSVSFTSDAVSANDNMLQEIATKAGFFHDINEYSKYKTSLLLKSFPNIIRYKGSMKCINLILNLFERLANTHIHEEYDKHRNVLTIKYEQTDANTLELLESLLSYVKPTGMFVDYVVYVDMSINDIIELTESTVNLTGVKNNISMVPDPDKELPEPRVGNRSILK